MVTMNKFLTLIKTLFSSPIEVTVAELPDDTIQAIDNEYQPKLDALDRQVAEAKTWAELQANVVMLAHQAALMATTANIALKHPTLTARIEKNPEDQEAREDLNKILQSSNSINSLDSLAIKLLAVCLKHYPILQNKRLQG